MFSNIIPSEPAKKDSTFDIKNFSSSDSFSQSGISAEKSISSAVQKACWCFLYSFHTLVHTIGYKTYLLEVSARRGSIYNVLLYKISF